MLDTGRSVYCIINKVSEEDKPLKDKMISLAMEIRNYVKSKFDIYISIGISKCFDNTAHMYAAYNQAMNCLKMKFSLGKGAIIHVEDLMDSLNRQKVLPLELSGEIVENIKLGNYRKVEDLTREMLFRLSKEQKAGEQMIKGICFDILASSLRVLKDERTTGHMKSGEKYFHSILNECTDVEELEEYLIITLMNIMDSIHLNTVSEENKTIDEILDYIDKFYMNDISLLTVSEYVYMNHIYVSRLIKKETGETFLDILTRMRMKKACELLVNSSSKIYEISNSVGIKDSGYFSQVFKKYQGVTPSEYRENISSRLNNTEAKS